MYLERRTFNGEEYQLVRSFTKKSLAKKFANSQRKKLCSFNADIPIKTIKTNARVIKVKRNDKVHYNVYVL